MQCSILGALCVAYHVQPHESYRLGSDSPLLRCIMLTYIGSLARSLTWNLAGYSSFTKSYTTPSGKGSKSYILHSAVQLRLANCFCLWCEADD